MGITQSFITCFKRSFDFKGRAARSEFWWFHLLYIVFTFLFGASVNTNIMWMFNALILIIMTLPEIAVTVRRLHDINKSGWWQTPAIILSFLLPTQFMMPEYHPSKEVMTAKDITIIFAFIGYTVFLYYLLIRKGDATENEYGSPRLSEKINA